MTLKLHGLEGTMTNEQKEYAESIYNNVLTITDSISGSGKTTIAVAVAKLIWEESRLKDENKELYYFFAPVQEDAFGFTPGDLEEKESKYLIPLYDALKKIGDNPKRAIYSNKPVEEEEKAEEVETPQKKKSKQRTTDARFNEPRRKTTAWVHATSHVFWRGGNIINSVVIIDEAQNWTFQELKKVLTRCHDDCTIILIGHQKQCDISQSASGFPSYKAEAEKVSFAKIVTLTHDFRGKLARWADNVEKLKTTYMEENNYELWTST